MATPETPTSVSKSPDRVTPEEDRNTEVTQATETPVILTQGTNAVGVDQQSGWICEVYGL